MKMGGGRGLDFRLSETASGDTEFLIWKQL